MLVAASPTYHRRMTARSNWRKWRRAYIWIGNGSAEGTGMLHSPHYDFNDAILLLGASYWVLLAE